MFNELNDYEGKTHIKLGQPSFRTRLNNTSMIFFCDLILTPWKLCSNNNNKKNSTFTLDQKTDKNRCFLIFRYASNFGTSRITSWTSKRGTVRTTWWRFWIQAGFLPISCCSWDDVMDISMDVAVGPHNLELGPHQLQKLKMDTPRPLGLEPVELPPHAPHGTLLGPASHETWGRNIETSKGLRKLG